MKRLRQTSNMSSTNHDFFATELSEKNQFIESQRFIFNDE